MYNIHRKQIILIALLVITSIGLQAQSNKGNYNFWEYRSKPFYFGLTLGVHSAGFLPNKSRQFERSDSITLVRGADQPGLNVNIITNLKIGEHFDFRFIPGFAFTERRLEFQNPDGRETFEKVESVFLEIPLLLRFKSVPYRDKRLFVVGGLKYSFDVANSSRTKPEVLDDLINISPHDFQFEVGAGIQMFFPYFIFSPEIKFSQGIGNIHIFNDSKPESRVIDSIISRALTISFHFEG
jgi:hypothetical protein